ncbi:MAG: PQQ-binding-like beta-propeller repeat protein, partial [Hyphomicrobiales bacterium]
MSSRWTGPVGAKGVLLVLAFAFALSGCVAYKAAQKKLGLGDSDDTILPGQRETVITSGSETSPDPELSSLPVVVPAAYTNPNWAQPGGVPSNVLQHVALGREIKRLWSVDGGTGSSSQGRLTASPIVSNGRVFVLDTRATVRAFDAKSGNRIWAKTLFPDKEEEDEGYGGGVASDGRLVFTTTAFGNVMALEADSGQLLWGRKLDSPIRAAPTVSKGRVFVTTLTNEVFCLSAEDGSVLWKFEGIAEPASLLASTSPAVHDGVVVVPYTSGEVIAFNVNDGRPIWGDTLARTGTLSSLAALNDISGRPVIEGNQAIAISHSGRMIAVNAKSGERLWSKNISGTQTPWVAGPYVFVITDDRTMLAMTRDQGKVRWSTTLPEGHLWSGPVLAGGRLIAVSSKGAMVNVNVQTGEVINQSAVGGDGIYISPVVAGSVIYI